MSDKCDSEVFEHGTQVFLTHTLAAADVETWVQKIAADSGQKVDWHYAGGRANVLTTGDTKLVKQAIANNRELHDEFYRKAVEQYKDSEMINLNVLHGIWKYNGF